ncbi:ABC transporter substrate-binding protein [Ammoniphilus sp. YIM 78166]|uniref:ABC transporter substrate-binding protein n=1 Tax=Ammoniphilus sp. YIM 78166 TaxID=1644106 RepID=UPI00196A5B71|nr:extracellular solute-binding protein [Ammoniphilus sp. YIM 78166]
MMRRRMRFPIAMLIIAMLVSLMTACGQSTSSPPPASSTQPTSSTPTPADSPGGTVELKTAKDIALYEGADREQRLIEGAKKEGKLTIYTSMAIEDMQKMVAAFEAKYGIKVDVWRAGSEKVVQRAVTETQAGRHDFDIVETNGPEQEALHREGLLQEVKSPYLNDLIPEAILPHKEWVATRLNIFVQAYNTQKVTKEELPKTYEDLLDPKWKGRLAIEAEDLDWFAEVIKDTGDEEKGLQLFKDIVATNGLSVRKGHTLLTQMVASGEVPLALTVYNYKAEQLKNEGGPIDWFAIEPAIARPNGVSVSKNAPHPFSAVLFYDFMISTEGQQMLGDFSFVPTSNKVDTKLNDMPMKFVDPAVVLDENEKWSKLYEDIIVKKSN